MLKNRFVPPLLGFLIGVVASVAFGAALAPFDTELIFPDRLARQRGLSLDDAGRLRIPLHERIPNGDAEMVVVIERDLDSRKLVSVEADGEGISFEYKTLGSEGAYIFSPDTGMYEPE